MIAADIRFEGFDSRSWTNLISLFNPNIVERLREAPSNTDDPTLKAESGQTPLGTLTIVVDEHGEPLKTFHSVRGRVKDFDGFPDGDIPSLLPTLTERYGAQRTVVIREGTMEQIVERLALRLGRGDDYVAQWLVLAQVLREAAESETLWVYPRPLARMPIPSQATVRRALDVILPDGKCLLVVVWHGTAPFTCFAVRRRNGSIDRVVGPDLIFRWTGPLGGDFRRDYRVITEAVSRSVAPVHVGLFSEARTLRHLLRAGERGAWARAVAVRDIVLYPAPPYAAVALSADAIRGATGYAAKLLGDLHLLDSLGLGSLGVSARVRSKVGQIASVTSTLGFNPLTALSRVLRRDHEEAADSPVD